MSRFALNRRTFLRGTGVALALPVLDAMLDGNGTAWADGKARPLRLGIFFFGNGVRLEKWTPSHTGADWVPSIELEPLTPHKEYVNVVSGFTALASCCRGHHGGSTAILSGVPLIELPPEGAPFSSKFGAATFDQIAAKRIAGDTPFPTLELGVSRRVLDDQGLTLTAISHKGPDSPQPPEFSPAELYRRLFGGTTPTPGLDPKLQLRASVLDVVRDDAKRLQARLGISDRARLDEHLTSLSELRRQILALPPDFAGCVIPGPVDDQNPAADEPERLEEVSELMMELLVAAWACDLNRVATFLFHGASGHTVFTNLGHTIEEHLLSHDPTQQEAVHRTVVFVVQRFARLLEKLKGRREGDSNLLDSSAIVLTTDTAEGYSHSDSDYPLVIAGRAGGALRHPGIHHRGSGQNTSNVMLSVLQAVGTGLTEVGQGLGFSASPCTEILP